MTKDLAVIENAAIIVGFETAAGFDLLQRQAKLFAASKIVPQTYQNNLADCAIALDLAYRIGASPLLAMQNLYVVHGRPAWSAQFLIATVNKSGKFSALRYEFEGKPGTDDWGCRAVATELASEKELKGSLITIGLAKREGWYSKNGSKWQTMPELMLQYRAASWFVRAYCPEIAMGIHTKEEIEDAVDMTQDIDGAYLIDDMPAEPAKGNAGVKDVLKAKTGPEPEPETMPGPESPEGKALNQQLDLEAALDAAESEA